MTKYRITWRHEVIIESDSKEDAYEQWGNLDLGKLNDEEQDKKIFRHDFIEEVSFEDKERNEITIKQ